MKLTGPLVGIIYWKVRQSSSLNISEILYFTGILGATLFLTPEYELTLDPDDSIALNPNEIPLVTFRKRITSKLGKPYGSCRIGFSIDPMVYWWHQFDVVDIVYSMSPTWTKGMIP